MTNWRKILKAAFERNSADPRAMALLTTGTLYLIDNAVYPQDAINIALDEVYAAGLLPARRELPVTMNVANTMRWADSGYFTIASLWHL